MLRGRRIPGAIDEILTTPTFQLNIVKIDAKSFQQAYRCLVQFLGLIHTLLITQYTGNLGSGPTVRLFAIFSHPNY